MSMQELVLSVACVVLAAALVVALLASKRRHKIANSAHAQVVDRLRRDLQALHSQVRPEDQVQVAVAEAAKRLDALNDQIHNKSSELQAINAGIVLAEDRAELAAVAFVPRAFTYEDSLSYQDAIRSCEVNLAELIKMDKATKCTKSWEIDGSARQGELMIKNLRRLALRTFNADADAAIANVRWNNYNAMESRIRKSEDTIEKTLEKWGIIVSDDYRDLKLQELRLTYEQDELKKRIREEQLELREQQREEERVRREAEAAEREAAREEKKVQLALQKAREELAESHASDLSRHQERIRELEARVADAEQRRQRALSMAQQTKRGHVYIASNVGSFGPSILKIGMTRRLDPMDRIWELSDASVPFDFDVHGLIATNDAPALEAQLHERFAVHRVNLVNFRKEFFEVSISDLQAVVSDLGFDVRLTLAAEARELQESLAIRRGKQ